MYYFVVRSAGMLYCWWTCVRMSDPHNSKPPWMGGCSITIRPWQWPVARFDHVLISGRPGTRPNTTRALGSRNYGQGRLCCSGSWSQGGSPWLLWFYRRCSLYLLKWRLILRGILNKSWATCIRALLLWTEFSLSYHFSAVVGKRLHYILGLSCLYCVFSTFSFLHFLHELWSQCSLLVMAYKEDVQ